MHILVPLDLVIQARNEGLNQMFDSTQTHKADFLKRLVSESIRFDKMGVQEESIGNYFFGTF